MPSKLFAPGMGAQSSEFSSDLSSGLFHVPVSTPVGKPVTFAVGLNYTGTSGDNTQDGTVDDDSFDYSQGGNDTLHGLDGADTFFMGTALTAADTIDGGTGNDTVTLSGDTFIGGGAEHGAGSVYEVTFSATTMTNVETLNLTFGVDYDITSNDATVAADAVLSVISSNFDPFVTRFDGSAETDGSFFMDGGEGSDEFIGGAGDDTMFGDEGDDTLDGGAGQDHMYGGDGKDIAFLTNGDTVDGGEGRDTINADTGGAYLVLGNDGRDDVYFSGSIFSDQIINGGAGSDTLHLNGFADIHTTNWAPFQSSFEHLILEPNSGPINVSALNGGNTIISFAHLDASTNGAFLHIIGGTGDDTLTGSDLDDTITDDTGNNTLYGGLGDDTMSVLNSAGLNELHGGQGNDDLTAGSQGGLFYGEGGNDKITGATVGTNNLFGGAADDKIFADQGGSNFVNGGSGNDKVYLAGTISQDGQIGGGGGTDQLALTGDVFLTVSNFDPSTMGFESMLIVPDSGRVTVVDDDSANSIIDFSHLPVSTNGAKFAILGGAGDDTITGSNIDDIIEDYSGSNILEGLAGDDRISLLGPPGGPHPGEDRHGEFGGSTGVNTLYGGNGNDVLEAIGAQGANTLYGGNNDDLLDTHDSTGTNTLFGEGGSDTLDASGSTGSAFLFGGDGNDDMRGGQTGDTINAGTGADKVAAAGGDDVIQMDAELSANDQIDGGGAFDVVFLDGDYSGANAVKFKAATMTNVEQIVLTFLNSYDLTTHDATVGAGDNLHIDGGGLFSNTSLHFDGSAETDGTFVVDGGEGGDVITGGDGSDDLFGGRGDDQIFSLAGGDTIDGGEGDDQVSFSGEYTSTTSILGGDDTDIIKLLNVIDVKVANFPPSNWGFEAMEIFDARVQGGNIDNTFDFSGIPLSIEDGTFVIDGGGGDDTLTGSDEGETIRGGSGDNTLNGLGGQDVLTVHDSTGTNSLNGGNGADRLTGGSAADTLKGGGGGDTLAGGGGVDQIQGGAGADTFAFVKVNDSGVNFGERDRIDFSSSDHDIIDVSNIDADTTQGGDQAFHFREGGNFTGTAGELIALVLGGKTVVFGDVNGDGMSDFGIELTTNTAVHEGDFIL